MTSLKPQRARRFRLFSVSSKTGKGFETQNGEATEECFVDF